MSRTAPLPPVLFHGTSTRWLGQILREGLMPCHITGRVPMLCLTDEHRVADHHAQHMAEDEEADPIIFRLPITRFDPSAFTLEDKFVELGPSAGRGVYAYEIMGEERWRNAGWSWSAMLRIGGAVGYTKPLPVTPADLLHVRRGIEA
ncbi:MAG TPA: hypothetical protein VM434_18535 [Beijerinckiaceae bacterium]|nr:hypothetical protein [Beijerinckiaceae bacterium]